MQGPRRDSDSADILTYFGEWQKSEFPGYQPGNVLPEKAGEGYAPPLPPPRSSRDLHCQQKMMIKRMAIEQYQYKSRNHKQYELFVLL